MKKLKLAVIGKDVSKSTSPQIHSFIARRMGNEVDYQRLSISEAEFENKIESIFEELDGFNVTIPYKLSVIPHLKNVKGDAAYFGAVNTVTSRDRTGNNTDGLGFELMLKNNGVQVEGKKALVLGAGGAGRSVAKKLLDGGATVFIYDKNSDNAHNVAKEFKGVTVLEEVTAEPRYLIVNATGVGMHKTEGVSPVGEEILKNCEVAADLIYVPEESRFLQIAKSLGKQTINGQAMLFYQAYYSECIYFGVAPDENQAKQLFTEFLKEKI